MIQAVTGTGFNEIDRNPYASKNVINLNEKKNLEATNKPDLVLKIPDLENPAEEDEDEPAYPSYYKKGFSVVVPSTSTSEPRSTSITITTVKPIQQTPKISRNPWWFKMERPILNVDRDKCIGLCPAPGYPQLVLLPHEDCDKYCFCAQGLPILFSCSPDKLFSLRKQSCNDASKVRCSF